MNKVPLIDLTPARHGGRAERGAWRPQIDEACREIGFFAIGGHGVPARVVDDLRASAQRSSPCRSPTSSRPRHPVAGTNRGYHPVGGEALSKANDAAAPPDLKEFFHVGPVDTSDDPYYTSALGRQHFMPNIWPAAPAASPRRRPPTTGRWTGSSCSSCAWPRSRSRSTRPSSTTRSTARSAPCASTTTPRRPCRRPRGSSGPAPTPTTAGSRSSPARTCRAASRS